jgi:toxin ParE1/3/4
MAATYSRTVQAERDLVAIANSLDAENPALAVRFLDAAEETFGFLADHPGAGGVCDFRDGRAAGARVWTIKGFRNHLVFYRPSAGGIDILRVVHGARDLSKIFGDS